jgi:hypothetical protein
MKLSHPLAISYGSALVTWETALSQVQKRHKLLKVVFFFSHFFFPSSAGFRHTNFTCTEAYKATAARYILPTTGPNNPPIVSEGVCRFLPATAVHVAPENPARK